MKTKLTIYLINSEYQNEADMLNNEKPTSKQEIVGVGNLYYLHSNISEPSWLDSFFGNTIDKKPFRNATSKAVMLIPVQVENNKRYFAITFGYGASLLNKSAIEERFGLKTVLNSVPANSIRRIAMTEVAGNARKSNEQMPKQSTISDFTLDIERDLLNGITASSDKNSIFSGTIITGSDYLNVSSNSDVNHIRDFLLSIYKVYSKETYKDNFSWIDHIAPVKDKTLKDKLDSKLIEIINAKEETIWMAVPSVIEWENIQGFKYQGDRKNIYPDILIEKVLDSFKEPLTHTEQLRSKKISVISNRTDKEIENWTAYKCLYGEIELDGSQYCINSGEWYKVESNYVDRINNDYSATSVSDIPFPHFQSDIETKESDYNKRLVDSNTTDFILMDSKDIIHGGASSKFELCDVLSRNGTFIHVKKYSGSATLSHLFNQGLTTAELVKSDKAFVAKANNQIAKQCTGKQDFTLTQNHPQVVVFAIISNKNDKIPNIPFFSKITFCNIKKRLEMMGINVEISSITKQSEKGTDSGDNKRI